MAFFLALVLTIGTISLLSINRENKDGQFSTEEIFFQIKQWDQLDNNNDGVMEIPENSTFTTEKGPVHGDHIVLVQFLSSYRNRSFIIVEGIPRVIPEECLIISPVHSFTVLLDIDGYFRPGHIRISEVEV